VEVAVQDLTKLVELVATAVEVLAVVLLELMEVTV
jgi:hypothetical protein